LDILLPQKDTDPRSSGDAPPPLDAARVMTVCLMFVNYQLSTIFLMNAASSPASIWQVIRMVVDDTRMLGLCTLFQCMKRGLASSPVISAVGVCRFGSITTVCPSLWIENAALPFSEPDLGAI
jgi:hypothetical protein